MLGTSVHVVPSVSSTTLFGKVMPLTQKSHWLVTVTIVLAERNKTDSRKIFIAMFFFWNTPLSVSYCEELTIREKAKVPVLRKSLQSFYDSTVLPIVGNPQTINHTVPGTYGRYIQTRSLLQLFNSSGCLANNVTKKGFLDVACHINVRKSWNGMGWAAGHGFHFFGYAPMIIMGDSRQSESSDARESMTPKYAVLRWKYKCGLDGSARIFKILYL